MNPSPTRAETNDSSRDPRDPLSGLKNPRRTAVREGLLVFVALAGSTILLLGLSGGLPFGLVPTRFHPVDGLSRSNPDRIFQTLTTSAQVVAGLLGIAITVVAIVVELAANRYSHRITRLFVREPVNIVVLSFFVLTTMQCLWVDTLVTALDGRDGDVRGAIGTGFAITMAMVSLSLLAVLPYFNFVLAFLSPLNMIGKIRDGALARISRVGPATMERTQNAVEESVDELQDVARSATEQNDRRVAMATVEAFAEMLERYDAIRDSMPPAWFEIAPAIAADPDFASLTPSALGEIERSGTWLEVKIMQQYLSLMSECVPVARDVANVIAIHTHRIATGPGRTRPGTRALCIRCMNSYLRTCINARDARTGYYIMNQYRLIAQAMLGWGEQGEALSIARHLRFYGELGEANGIPFLLEAVAHDLLELIECDLENGAVLTDDLLTLLLEIAPLDRESRVSETLLGVRCSQMQIATLFLERGDRDHAEKIATVFARDAATLWTRSRNRIEQAHDPQYWEFTARGVNFTYLSRERRARLPELERMVHDLRGGAAQIPASGQTATVEAP